MENIKLETINLDVNGIKISLTLEQARAIWELFDELFRKATEPVYIPWWIYSPYTYGPWEFQRIVTCGTNSITITMKI